MQDPSSDTINVVTQPITEAGDALSIAEHYKLVVEDARALGDRRETINNLFVSIISLIAGGQGYVLVMFPGTGVGLAVIVIATLFGLSLCSVWNSALLSYKELLDIRYVTLKSWEEKYNFPSIQQFYTTEAVFYGDVSSPPTELLKEISKKDSIGKVSSFVSMYVALPLMARRIFFTLSFAQSITILWPVIARMAAQALPAIVRTYTHIAH